MQFPFSTSTSRLIQLAVMFQPFAAVCYVIITYGREPTVPDFLMFDEYMSMINLIAAVIVTNAAYPQKFIPSKLVIKTASLFQIFAATWFSLAYGPGYLEIANMFSACIVSHTFK